jgi:hypothetical protein
MRADLDERQEPRPDDPEEGRLVREGRREADLEDERVDAAGVSSDERQDRAGSGRNILGLHVLCNGEGVLERMQLCPAVGPGASMKMAKSRTDDPLEQVLLVLDDRGREVPPQLFETVRLALLVQHRLELALDRLRRHRGRLLRRQDQVLDRLLHPVRVVRPVVDGRSARRRRRSVRAWRRRPRDRAGVVVRPALVVVVRVIVLVGGDDDRLGARALPLARRRGDPVREHARVVLVVLVEQARGLRAPRLQEHVELVRRLGDVQRLARERHRELRVQLHERDLAAGGVGALGVGGGPHQEVSAGCETVRSMKEEHMRRSS